jgi:hypothetical protein
MRHKGPLHMFKLLAVESSDLSQAEKKTIFVKAEQIHKMIIIFTQKRSKVAILSENSYHFQNLLSSRNSCFLLSLR